MNRKKLSINNLELKHIEVLKNKDDLSQIVGGRLLHAPIRSGSVPLVGFLPFLRFTIPDLVLDGSSGIATLIFN